MNARWTAAEGRADEALTAIDEMYGRLGGSYFEILGVARECDAEGLRAAYRKVCERFHPDLYTDAELGPRRSLLDLILREATNAFQVLIRPELRAEYEQMLGPGQEPYGAPPSPPPNSPVAQSVIAFGDRAAVEAPPGSREGVPPSAASMSLRFPTPVLGVNAPPPPSEAVPPPPSPRSGSMLKRTPIAALQATPAPLSLRPETSAPVPSPPSPEPPRTMSPSAIPARRDPPPTPPPATTRAQAQPSVAPPREAAAGDRTSATMTSLQRGRAEMLLRQKRQQRQEFDTQVALAVKTGEVDKALQMLRHALTLDPEDESLSRRIQQLEAAARSTDVERTVQAARAHERSGRWELAAELWAKAAAHHPNEYSYHLYGAHAFCESGNELAKAVDLARRAIRLRPDAVEAHLCLARAFFRAGRTASAKSAMEQAMKLAPQNPAVVELARQLRM